METGKFQKSVVLTPDFCGQDASLSPLAAFTIFQGVASEHAEQIGVGGAAMARRGEFWLTVHTRVDFYGRAYLMQTLTAETWPERCTPESVRCFRGYRLLRGDTLIARGRTQWAILGPEQKILRFSESGFPTGFPFPDEAGIDEAPARLRDDFTPDDLVCTHVARATDIDMGRHVNNVAYIRMLLDCFTAKELVSGRIRSIEAHYASACFEGQPLGIYRKDEDGACRLAVKKEDGKVAVLARIVYAK